MANAFETVKSSGFLNDIKKAAQTAAKNAASDAKAYNKKSDSETKAKKNAAAKLKEYNANIRSAREDYNSGAEKAAEDYRANSKKIASALKNRSIALKSDLAAQKISSSSIAQNETDKVQAAFGAQQAENIRDYGEKMRTLKEKRDRTMEKQKNKISAL